MKKTLLILLLLTSHIVFTQTIWFQMQRVNYCTKAITVDSSTFYLVDKLGVSYRNIAGKVLLKEKGEFELYYPNLPNTAFPPIKITSNETFTYIKNRK